MVSMRSVSSEISGLSHVTEEGKDNETGEVNVEFPSYCNIFIVLDFVDKSEFIRVSSDEKGGTSNNQICSVESSGQDQNQLISDASNCGADNSESNTCAPEDSLRVCKVENTLVDDHASEETCECSKDDNAELNQL